MHSHDRTSKTLAIGLSLLAGFVDALGFLSLGGFFVSFMSGNSTRFAVGMADNISLSLALIPLGIIAFFVIGVMAGCFIRHLGKQHPSTSILIFMAVMLTGAALATEVQWPILAGPLMAIAMGSANNIFMREGEVSIGVTYMTGTLVKLGQRLAGKLLGKKDSPWFPYLLLWAGLVTGALLGASGYHWLGLNALWAGIAFCACLAALSLRMEKRQSE